MELAKVANVSAPTLRRMEASAGAVEGMRNNVASVVAALQADGVTFLDGNYSGPGGPGVRLTQSAGPSIDGTEMEQSDIPDVSTINYVLKVLSRENGIERDRRAAQFVTLNFILSMR